MNTLTKTALHHQAGAALFSDLAMKCRDNGETACAIQWQGYAARSSFLAQQATFGALCDSVGYLRMMSTDDELAHYA